MKRAIAATVILFGCKGDDGAKEREIAALRAQLAAQQQPAAVPPTAPSEALPPDVLHKPVEVGNLDGAELAAFLVLADGNKAITYAHLIKNADRYKGKEWAFAGPILEIGEHGGKTVARINYGSYGDAAVWVEAPFETEFLQGKTVDVAGVIAGSYSYKSQAGWQITVPAVLATSIQKRGSFDRARAASRKATKK